MITIIIASFNEPNSIGSAIKRISDSAYSGIPNQSQIIQVSPDKPTLEAGYQAGKNLKNFIQIVDPRKGKSFALNMALEKATGDIIILTDGDVVIGKSAISEMIKPFENSKIGGVSGQPLSTNTKSSFMGYLSHFFTYVADRKRKDIFTTKEDSYFTSQDGYFPLSGYLTAIRNLKELRYDPRYIDDAYISLRIIAEKMQLAYQPNATVLVKFPTNLKDYFVQRYRNLKGTEEVHNNTQFQKYKNERSFAKELEYLFAPIQYADTARTLLYGLFIYPLRLMTWIYIFFKKRTDRELRENKVWAEIDSTK